MEIKKKALNKNELFRRTKMIFIIINGISWIIPIKNLKKKKDNQHIQIEYLCFVLNIFPKNNSYNLCNYSQRKKNSSNVLVLCAFSLNIHNNVMHEVDNNKNKNIKLFLFLNAKRNINVYHVLMFLLFIFFNYPELLIITEKISVSHVSSIKTFQ